MTNVNGVNQPLPGQVQDQPPHPTEMWEIRHFVDPAVGVEIQMAIPPDPLKPVHFRSQVNVMTNRGPLTIQFDVLDSTTIQEACQHWHASAKRAVEEAQQKMRDAQRRIVVPGAPGAPFNRKPTGVN